MFKWWPLVWKDTHDTLVNDLQEKLRRSQEMRDFHEQESNHQLSCRVDGLKALEEVVDERNQATKQLESMRLDLQALCFKYEQISTSKEKPNESV